MKSGVVWPLAVNIIRGRRTQNTFGMVRKYSNGSPKPHQGWDFEAAVGTPAYAIAEGTVVWTKNHGDYGLQLCMSFRFEGSIHFAFYAHLHHIYIKKGKVAANEIVAACGKSGNAANLAPTEDHLHFEIRTQEHPRFGLHDRLSPLKVFGQCPLKLPVAG